VSQIDLVNGYLQYYMHIADPDGLSDEDWLQKYKVMSIIRKRERELSEGNN